MNITPEDYLKNQFLTCPAHCRKVYKAYMDKKSIPYKEVTLSKMKAFMLPRKYRPHAWKLKFD